MHTDLHRCGKKMRRHFCFLSYLCSSVFICGSFSSSLYADAWPIFRGDAEANGVSAGELPEKPVVVWQRKLKGAQFESTPAIVDGVVYLAHTTASFVR